MKTGNNVLRLNGAALTLETLWQIAQGECRIELDPDQLQQVRRAAEFLAELAAHGEPIYGVNTGFGSNADKLLGAERARKSKASDDSLLEELQHNLIRSHAVCVGKPLAAETVRAMLAIRINTLMRGHSGIRAETLQALADLLNADIVPVVPEKGSVGASGDLAPLSHLALALLGEGEVFYRGERVASHEALDQAGLRPIKLGLKEGLALNNGTAQMLAQAALSIVRLEGLIATADMAAAMSLEAFAGRSGAFAEQVHALRPHPGQVETAKRLRALLDGSTLMDIDYALIPQFKPWTEDAGSPDDTLTDATFDIQWQFVLPKQRQGREAFYAANPPFKGGKRFQPQDAYCLRCIPQVHGAVRDAVAQARRVIAVELNAVTDNPLVFPHEAPSGSPSQYVISAGHFHGMPLALAMSYVKTAIPVLASISERRLNKLLDPATNDGLPAFLIGNEDGTDSGFMIVQYTAAALVNDLATRAHPASVYSIPTSANAEDHVSMGTNEIRHVHEMLDDLTDALALELYVAAQALDLRLAMLAAARKTAQRPETFRAKIAGAPSDAAADDARRFEQEAETLRKKIIAADFLPAPALRDALARIRAQVPFLPKDRLMAADIQAMTMLVRSGVFAQMQPQATPLA